MDSRSPGNIDPTAQAAFDSMTATDWDQLQELFKDPAPPEAAADVVAAIPALAPATPPAPTFAPANPLAGLGLNLNFDQPALPLWEGTAGQFSSPEISQAPQVDQTQSTVQPTQPVTPQPTQPWQHQHAPVLPPLSDYQGEYALPQTITWDGADATLAPPMNVGQGTVNPRDLYAPLPAAVAQPQAQLGNYAQAAYPTPATINPALIFQQHNPTQPMNLDTNHELTPAETVLLTPEEALVFPFDENLDVDQLLAPLVGADTVPQEQVEPEPRSNKRKRTTKAESKTKSQAKSAAAVPDTDTSAPAPAPRKRRRVAKESITAPAEDDEYNCFGDDDDRHSESDSESEFEDEPVSKKRKSSRKKSSPKEKFPGLKEGDWDNEDWLAAEEARLGLGPLTRRAKGRKGELYPDRVITPRAELMALSRAGRLPLRGPDGKVKVLYTDNTQAPHGKNMGIDRVCGECMKLVDDWNIPKGKRKETVRRGCTPGTTVLIHCNACGLYSREVGVRKSSLWGIQRNSYPEGDEEYPPLDPETHLAIIARCERKKRIIRRRRELAQAQREQQTQADAAMLLLAGGQEEE